MEQERRHEQHGTRDGAAARRTEGRPAREAGAAAVAPRAARAVRTLAGVHAAAGFVARIAELDAAGVRAFVHAWHRVVAADAGSWFAAEAAVAEAVARSHRQVEQRVLLRQIAETITNTVWYRSGQNAAGLERRAEATEPSAQYAATLAMLALLVRDHLEERDFALVHAPFAGLIAVEELAED